MRRAAAIAETNDLKVVELFYLYVYLTTVVLVLLYSKFVSSFPRDQRQRGSNPGP